MAVVRMCVAVLTALMVLVGPRGASAQQGGRVSGTVTDRVTNQPVANATIVLESPTVTKQGKSGADGTFTIAEVPPGSYHLLARAEGYAPSRTEMTVTATAAPAQTAAAQTANVSLDPSLHFSEVASVSPEKKDQFESFQATDVLGGQELTKALQPTLGATIENEPGVALRSFGPGSARPVIRGLDGDRVLIVADGLRMGDLSSQSGDHGVNVNPASASRIEVVRGPATLLYGANAIGGLVNVITNEIPDAPVTRPTGSFTFDAGTAAGVAAGAGDITLGSGNVALHASGSGRRAGNYDSADGEIPNSYSRAGFAQVGAAYTGQTGYVGGSYAYDRTHYAIPFVEEGETNLNPRRNIVNLRGEKRSLTGFFDSLRGSFGVRRYRHDELDGDVVATAFKNDTTELEVLAHHRAVGRLRGSIGGAVLTRAFETVGEEALSPAVKQRGVSGYVYEELAASSHVQVQFGGRVEHATFSPEKDEPHRDFTNVSGSVGLLLLPTDQTTIAVSVARASRNPALEELYFHGPHAGNNAFENGDPDLESEQALGFDVSFRWRGSIASGEVTYFLNHIDNFIFRELTGGIEDGLPETFFTQGDSRLQGIESHVDFRVGPMFWIEGGLDYVRGELTALDQPLPRIPPLRGRAGVRFQRNAFQAGIDGIFTAKQDRIFFIDTPTGPVGETPTNGYNLMKLFASYSFVTGKTTSTITARLDNATNALYFNHLNYLKDLAPEIGRDFRVVYSVKF
jgi:iron complex outermembrane recepter protein